MASNGTALLYFICTDFIQTVKTFHLEINEDKRRRLRPRKEFGVVQIIVTIRINLIKSLKHEAQLKKSCTTSKKTYFPHVAKVIWVTLRNHVTWVPCRYGMGRPRVADRRDDWQIWRVVANMLNKPSRTADSGWPSSLGFGREANNHSRKGFTCCEVFPTASEMNGFSDRGRWRVLVNTMMDLRVL
jgi:hypothetical protein